LGWIGESGRRSFTLSEARQARRWIVKEDMAGALGYLAESNVIRKRTTRAERPLGGRPAVLLGPGGFERGLDGSPIGLAGALEDLEPVKRFVVLRLRSQEKALALRAARSDGLVGARGQRGELHLNLGKVRLHFCFVGIPG
jgi:hypothetical protein